MEPSPAVREYLAGTHFPVLATINPNGTPQQSVIWYELEENRVLMNTKRGRRKDRNLRRDPRASLCFVDGYRFITLLGEVELVDDVDIAQRDIRRLATRYHGPAKAAQQMETQFSQEERVAIHFAVRWVQAYGFR
jgi:PPOX class probable F420-dependent enzyme